ncbi:MAG TPA: site-2 protease family protein [Polyangiaceae bacterium]|nr:site-2 protease family protein [Polyangiaceae bacterium]
MNVDYDPAPRLPVSAGERLFVVLLSMSFLSLIGADLAHSFSPNKLSALFVLLFWVPLLVLHELAHALAARSVGWHVSEVVLGFGRELVRFRIGATRVRLRAMPVEGYVVPSPNTIDRARGKQAWIYAAGPLSELAVLGVVALLLDFQLPAAGDSVGRIALQSLGVTAALGALCTLVPYSAGGHPSDGLGIVLSLFTPEESFRQRLCWPFLSDARRLLLREQVSLAQRRVEAGLQQFPDEPRLLGALAVCEAAAGQPERAYEMLEALGPPESQLPQVRAELLADAAWAVLFGAQRELYSDAQRALDQARELAPFELHYQILLGRIHLEQGRPEHAYAQLMAAYKRTRDVDQEAQCVAYLALCCSELKGTPGAPPAAGYAERFARAAETLDVPPALRQRVQLSTGKR